MSLKLIADSGSSKTDWAIINEAGIYHHFRTSGMNPSLMSDEALLKVLYSELTPTIKYILKQNTSFSLDQEKSFSSLIFYGSGCRPEQHRRMIKLLKTELNIQKSFVYSDLLGAAHALCGKKEGIVCILGTGSASAVYDGTTFVQQTPSLGYIIGDEGSGASLGKRLLANVFKQQIPSDLYMTFIKQYQLTLSEVIEQVYRKDTPNRYLAQFTHFLSEQIQHSYVQEFLYEEFCLFFQRNILAYQRPNLKVNFIGSIASIFSDQLNLAACNCNIKIGRILDSPLHELVRFWQ